MADHDAEPEPQPLDEEAAWAAIVAGYGEEPADPPGTRPFKSVDDLKSLDSKSGGATQETSEAPAPAAEAGDTSGTGDTSGGVRGPDGTRTTTGPATGTADGADAAPEAPGPDSAAGSAGPGEAPPRGLGSSVLFAPGVGVPVPAGPRDYTPAEDPDEGHFVPPEPPPLPESDATAKFAWLGAIGGPVLALIAVLLQWDMTWWLTTVCAGGFLGGIATLVARMKHDDEDDEDDPGRGAVV